MAGDGLLEDVDGLLVRVVPIEQRRADALRNVRRAARKRRAAEQAWRDAIRAAHSVLSLREIAAPAGVSHARVHQILSDPDQ